MFYVDDVPRVKKNVLRQHALPGDLRREVGRNLLHIGHHHAVISRIIHKPGVVPPSVKNDATTFDAKVKVGTRAGNFVTDEVTELYASKVSVKPIRDSP